MNLFLLLGIIILITIVSVIVTRFSTKKKFSGKLYELQVRNEVLELRQAEVSQQLSELMKLKEQADQRLFNLDKYLAVAIREKELTYEQISKLEQRMQEEKEIKEQLQFKI